MKRALRRPPLLVVLAVALGLAAIIAARHGAARRDAANDAARSGFNPQDVIGTCDGDPILLAGTRSVTPVYEPSFVSPSDPRFMKERGATYIDEEPVIGITAGGTSKAYSTWFLNDREMVHDIVGEQALLVTW